MFAVLAAPTQASADNFYGMIDSWTNALLALLAILAILAIIILLATAFFPEAFAAIGLEWLVQLLWGAEEISAEAAIAEEEAAAAERLQALVDQVNPLGGDRNCVWCAQEVDEALGDMFAGETPRPYAPYWSEPGMVPPGADIARLMELVNEYGGLQLQSMEQIAMEVQNAGNGARGFVVVANHVFNVVNYGGKVFFLDGQVAGVLANIPDVSGLVGFIPTFGF